MIKSLRSGQNVHVLNTFTFTLEWQDEGGKRVSGENMRTQTSKLKPRTARRRSWGTCEGNTRA